VSYTVKTSGDSLTVNVSEKPAVSGANYAFDNIVLTTGPPDTQAPSVPQCVVAIANSATSVTVSWAASSDNTGVAGYHVYRGRLQGRDRGRHHHVVDRHERAAQHGILVHRRRV